MRARVILTIITLLTAPISGHAIEPGEKIPEFSLPLLNGESVSNSSFRGRYLYLDFWASWCAPCKFSFPWMNQLRARYPKEQLEILAINLDRQTKDLERFLSKNEATFLIALDPQGTTPILFKPPGMPTSYIVSPDGVVESVHVGFKESSASALEQELQQLLEKKP